MNRRNFLTALAAVMPGIALAQVDQDDADFTPEAVPTPGDDVIWYCGDKYGNWWVAEGGKLKVSSANQVIASAVKFKNGSE